MRLGRHSGRMHGRAARVSARSTHFAAHPSCSHAPIRSKPLDPHEGHMSFMSLGRYANRSMQLEQAYQCWPRCYAAVKPLTIIRKELQTRWTLQPLSSLSINGRHRDSSGQSEIRKVP